nr:hypothetical protein [Aliivibrio fischeri]
MNQGTSGGHDKNLNVADIVLGKRTVNIGNLKAPKTPEGKGSNLLTWIPMDIMASSGSAGGDDANKIRYYEGSSALISSAHKVKYNKGKVVEGTIGSANFGTSTEEMESASAAQISEAYKIPFLAIRILSNNATNGGHYNPNTAKYCQSYVKDVVIQYISDLNLK